MTPSPRSTTLYYLLYADGTHRYWPGIPRKDFLRVCRDRSLDVAPVRRVMKVTVTITDVTCQVPKRRRTSRGPDPCAGKTKRRTGR